MAFATATTIVPLSMIFGCGVIVDTLLYGSTLLEESLAFMENAKNQRKMTLNNTLVRHLKDLLSLWYDYTELFQR